MDIGRAVSIGLKITFVPLSLFAFGIIVVNRFSFATRENIRALSLFLLKVFVPVTFILTHGSGLSWDFFVDIGWKLPVCQIVGMVIAFICGRVVALFSGAPKWFEAWFTLAITFSSALAVPLMLMQGVCAEVFWETEQECLVMARVRVLFFIVPMDIIVLSAGLAYVYHHAQEYPAPSNADSGKAAQTDDHKAKLEMVGKGLPHADAEVGRAGKGLPDGDAEADGIETTKPAPSHGLKRRLPLGMMQEGSLCRAIASNLWSPPIVGETIGILIGLTSVQRLFFGGSDPPLAFVMTPLKALDGALVPIANLVPALNLGHKCGDLWHGKEKEIIKVWLRPVLALLITKSVLMPVILIGCLLLAMHVGFITAADGRVTQLVLFAEAACPTAPLLIILAASLGHSQAAEVMALALVPQLIMLIFITPIVVSVAVKMTA